MASPSISNHHSSNNYLKLVKPELEEIFRKPYPQIFAEVWEYYEQAMLEHFPFIGGDRSSGTKNLTGCMFFIAIGVVGKRYGLSIHRKDRKNAENAARNPGSFVTQTMTPTEEYPVIYHNQVCPIYEFCKARGYMEYLPYMCNLDYVMFHAFGVALYREKTCATGDDVCDFKMKRGAAIPAVWPPHILDESDPLK